MKRAIEINQSSENTLLKKQKSLIQSSIFSYIKKGGKLKDEQDCIKTQECSLNEQSNKENKEENKLIQTDEINKETAKASKSDLVTINEILLEQLGPEWFNALYNEFDKVYFKNCQKTISEDRKHKKVYPPIEKVYNAFKLTPLSAIKVVIVGQDPYHQPGQAMGLCFSVQKGIKFPPSLKNIFNEIGINPPYGDLTNWAKQGVFLLNSLLTVVDSTPMAHKNSGWETFTDKVIEIINNQCEKVVFLLWGKAAQKKASHVDRKKHYILESGHPSPLSVRFFQGCKHFEVCNKYLEEQGRTMINWKLLN